MNSKAYIAGILSALTLIAIGTGAYLLGRNTQGRGNRDSNPSPTAITPLRTPSPIDLVTPTQNPQTTGKDTVQAAVVSKNYSSLTAYMTNPISVRIEASECCNPMSPTDAVEQLKYLNSAKGTWDFNNQEVISGLEASYPENYGNAIIGVSSDNYLVGFQLNAQNSISKISMSVSYKLLLP